MNTPKQNLERTIQALSDEINWGLRCFYTAKIIFETELRLTPTLFDTFYFACLDQSGLILSRYTIPKQIGDQSVNFQWLLEKTETEPFLFGFAQEHEIKELVQTQRDIFTRYEPLSIILRDQRDRNIAHLDRKNITNLDFRVKQGQINLSDMESFYKELLNFNRELLSIFSWQGCKFY